MNGIPNNSQAAPKNLIARTKSLTPSVLGMAHSHGVKFSLNMTSEDKKELMSKLEEWRKARKDKLAARILTRQKQFEKPKTSITVPPVKNRQPSLQHDGSFKNHDRQSVFERLYNSNKEKFKKPGDDCVSSKPLELPPMTHALTYSEKPFEPVRVLEFEAARSEASAFPAKELKSSKLAEECIAEISGRSCDAISENESEDTETLTNPRDATQEVSAGTERQSVTLPLETSCPVECIEAEFCKTVSVPKNIPASSKIPVTSMETQKCKHPLRRSVSMMFRQKCRKEFAMRRSISAKNLKELSSGPQRLNRPSGMTAPPPAADRAKGGKTEPVVNKSVSFVTPKRDKSSGSNNLRTKLEDWLKVNGHSLEGYRHLRCFGIANPEKWPTPTAAVPSDLSFETSYYATAPNTPASDSDKENVTPPTVLHQQVDAREVENWLRELHRLIVEIKYPPERCEEWLAAIRKKCNACSQFPIFWECLAALHESKGDLTSAIEDYERAIIKGGEVDAVGESLAQLFEKMVVEQRHHSKPKMEKGIDPKNIFKSTIIKFALQQKALKKLSSELDPNVRQQLYVATPVRRSTRIQTPHKSGDEVASLQTLTPELRKNVIFKPNESLLRGD